MTTHTRAAISARRQQIFMSIIGSLVFIGFTRFALGGAPGLDHVRYDAVFQQPYSAYPAWVGNGWLPLDLLVGAVLLYEILHTLLRIDEPSEPETTISLVGMVLRMSFGVLGSMLGVIGVGIGGWYMGLEYYVIGGVFGCVFMVALGIFAGVIFGLGWLIREGYRRYVARFVAPILAPLKRFFTAQDVPEDPKI